MNKALIVTTCGRRDYLERTMASFAKATDLSQFTERWIIDDSGDGEYFAHLSTRYGSMFGIVRHPARLGLSKAIYQAFALVRDLEVDWVFHLEDDWTFPGPLDVDLMCGLGYAYNLAQVALYRQPWTPEEHACGGYLGVHGDAYTPIELEHLPLNLYRHERLFSFNPCVYPKRVAEACPKGGLEADVTAALAGERFGVLTGPNDSPLTFHIGAERSAGWRT